MRKALKLLGFLSATLVLFFVVAALAFYHLVRIGEVRRFLVDEIQKQTELKVQLGGADLEIGWITGIVFRDVALSEPGAVEPALTAERVTARVALRPLLRRQVIFYEIHLTGPAAHLVRDGTGRIPLVDKLLNVPFFKQGSNDFSFDLRKLVVDGGNFDLADPSSSSSERKWQLVNGRTEVQRLRGQELREYFQRFLKTGQSESSGLGLQFDLKGLVINGGAKMNIRSRGYVVLPRETLDIRQARWNADLELVDMPAALVKDLLAPGMPIRTISGHVGERMHIEGDPLQQVRLRGDIEFKQLSIDAPAIFSSTLDRAEGRITFDVEGRPEMWRLQRVDFLTSDLRFSLKGEVNGTATSNPRVRLSLSTLPMAISVLRTYLPLKLLGSAWVERVVSAMESGQFEIKKASLDATLTEIRELARGAVPMGFSVETELRDLSGKLPVNNGLPLRTVTGRMFLTNRVLTFQGFRGAYGDSRFTELDGSYDLASGDGGKLELYTRADVNLAELKTQLTGQELAAQLAFLASLEELSGRSKIEVSLKRPNSQPWQFEGKMTLENVRARYNEYVLNNVEGNVAFSSKDLSAEKIRAQLNGSPIQAQIALKDYNTDGATFDVSVESGGVRAGMLTSLLLDTGSPRDTGIVRGAIRYTGSVANKAQGKLTGTLDLLNVQTRLKPLFQPLRALNGRISIDESGIDFQKMTASLVGFPVTASGRWRYRQNPQLLFEFAAPDLDITYLISQIDPELSDFYATLVADGKITLNKGRIKNFDFSDLTTSAAIDHRVWRLTNLRARSAGGEIQGVTTIFDKPDTLQIVADPKINDVPIQSFLNWFNLSTTEMSGKVRLTGKLETVGNNDTERKRNLNGAFNLKIEDGTIHRMRIVVQLLNLLDLSRWFTFQIPDLTKQGIRFRAITADFKVTNGIYSTDNLIVDSSDLRMTGAGKIDVPKDELDFVVAVRPFAGIDAAISYIPLLGRSIAAIKNSFLVASFNITGRIDEPTITPAPLGTVSEWFWGVLGIPKNIIGFGESEKKEPTQPATEAPPP